VKTTKDNNYEGSHHEMKVLHKTEYHVGPTITVDEIIRYMNNYNAAQQGSTS